MRVLTPVEANALDFQRDGVVVARQVVSPSWLKVLSQAADDLREQAYDLTEDAGETPPRTHFKDNAWAVDPNVRRFLYESDVVALAADVLQSENIHLYGDGMFRREPGATTTTPWHQDEQAWPVAGEQMCSVWLSTEAITPETGSLQFILGSHRGPLYTPAFKPQPEFGRTHQETWDAEQPDIAADPDQFPITSFAMQPGDVIVFHPRMLHASAGTASDHPKRSFSFRFLGDDIRWLRKQSVYLDSVLAVPLQDGDTIDDPQFPLVWSRGGRVPDPQLAPQ